ncbi:MAG: amylo-alpha-1,6-glucosidase [Terriglobia bacterium]
MPRRSGDLIRVRDQYYILATSSLADTRTQVLKHDGTFAVFDRVGDLARLGQGLQGLYHDGTRFLSRLVLKIEGERPMLLSSSVQEDNVLLAVDLTNPDIHAGGKLSIPRGSLHISRSKFLWKAVCFEQLRLTNFSLSPVVASLSIEFDADFADVFEVRGIKRERKGRFLPEEVNKCCAILRYEGLDGVVRKSRLLWAPNPDSLSEHELRFDLRLEPKGVETLFLTAVCETDGETAGPFSFGASYAKAAERINQEKADSCHIYTSNEQYNDWLNRSIADLRMLVTDTPTGPYPYAGVPWFSTVFGRDGIITALEMLWMAPGIAKGVLAYLAATQARELDLESDAEPGKIVHEMREGEMAALKEVPFGRYYGSVDATPLFVMLAAAYYARTGDRPFIEQIWPNIQLALDWINNYGDADGDGFVEYLRQSSEGLEQQGWKDSRDAISHSDGSLAEPPIALCEVQGYVYAARRGAAEIAAALGDAEAAGELGRQAQALQEKFEHAFWCEDISSYALALDGNKRSCQVLASNAGHALFTGIATPEHGRQAAATLLSTRLFSGWGIRTLGDEERRYNPMSYHNGSVWPHDNALIAHGMARYRLSEEAAKVLTAIFDAAIFFDLHRLPELFCGFGRQQGEGPILYPVACLPQAWSAAAVFMLLGACLGISIDGERSQVRFTHAFLPESLPEVQLRNLKVGRGSVDLSIRRFGEDVTINVLRRDGPVEIISLK